MESNDKPINPYRVIGDLMKVLDPKASFVTADSGNTRDQTSTVYEAQIPRGHLGWGNVSTLGFSLAGAVAPSSPIPERQCVNITGDAGVCYMMGSFEALRPLQDRHHDGPHQQRRLFRLWPGLLGRRARPLHLESLRSWLGVHGVDGAFGGLSRRGRKGAVRNHSGVQARASPRTRKAGRRTSSSSARTIRCTAGGSGVDSGLFERASEGARVGRLVIARRRSARRGDLVAHEKQDVPRLLRPRLAKTSWSVRSSGVETGGSQ